MPYFGKGLSDDEILEARNKSRRDNYKQTRANGRKFKQTYTKDEIKLIMAHEIPDRELSKQIGRSVEAIQVLRSKINHGTR